MESVIWAFKQLWDKGLLYEAYRVMPYSWGAETPLSNFEIRLDDAMRPRQDPALTVGFALDPRTGDPDATVCAIGSAVRDRYQRELGDGTVVGTVTGADLLGRTYTPLFDYF